MGPVLLPAKGLGVNESGSEGGSASLHGPNGRALLRVGQRRAIHASSTLCAEGQAIDRFFVVMAGQFEIAKCIAGQRHILSISGPGSLLALMPALDGEPCAVSISALGDATVVEIKREDLLALLDHDGEQNLPVANLLSLLAIRRLRGATDELAKALYSALQSPERRGRIDTLQLARIQAGSYAWLGD